MISTLANLDLFPKLFHCEILKEILYTYFTDCTPHLKYFSAVPREIWNLQLLPISMAYCMCETLEFMLHDNYEA